MSSVKKSNRARRKSNEVREFELARVRAELYAEGNSTPLCSPALPARNSATPLNLFASRPSRPLDWSQLKASIRPVARSVRRAWRFATKIAARLPKRKPSSVPGKANNGALGQLKASVIKKTFDQMQSRLKVLEAAQTHAASAMEALVARMDERDAERERRLEAVELQLSVQQRHSNETSTKLLDIGADAVKARTRVSVVETEVKKVSMVQSRSRSDLDQLLEELAASLCSRLAELESLVAANSPQHAPAQRTTPQSATHVDRDSNSAVKPAPVSASVSPSLSALALSRGQLGFTSRLNSTFERHCDSAASRAQLATELNLSKGQLEYPAEVARIATWCEQIEKSKLEVYAADAKKKLAEFEGQLQQYELSSPAVVTNYYEKKSQIVTDYFEKKSQLLGGETSTSWPMSPAPGLLSRLVTQSPTGTSSPIAELLPLTESKLEKSAHAAAFMADQALELQVLCNELERIVQGESHNLVAQMA